MDYLICLDSVWAHDPVRRRIKRLAGVETPTSPLGKWRRYVELAAGTASTNPTLPTGEPARPGSRLLIRRRDDWKGTTDVTSPIMFSAAGVAPTGEWITQPDLGWIIPPPRESPWLRLPLAKRATIGIAAILDIADQLPAGADDKVKADYYWPVEQIDGGDWAVTESHRGTPLIVTDEQRGAVEMALLLARHPIPAYLSLTATLLGAGEWDVGPTDLVPQADDAIALQLNEAGWSIDEVAAMGPHERRRLMREAYELEQAGTPWPHVRMRHSGENGGRP